MNKIDLKYGLSKVGLPLIVTSNTPNLCFLIDTGATHNVIFSFVAKALHLSSDNKREGVKLSGIDGTNHEAQKTSLILYILEEVVPVEFYVLDATETICKVQEETGVQIHGILGVPFLDDHNCIIDFNEQLLKFG